MCGECVCASANMCDAQIGARAFKGVPVNVPECEGVWPCGSV